MPNAAIGTHSLPSRQFPTSADLANQEVTSGSHRRRFLLRSPMADRKRDGLQRLYRHDQRVAPWAGTAHGVLKAVNTYEHHEATVRGAERGERNMLKTVTGGVGGRHEPTFRHVLRDGGKRTGVDYWVDLMDLSVLQAIGSLRPVAVEIPEGRVQARKPWSGPPEDVSAVGRSSSIRDSHPRIRYGPRHARRTVMAAHESSGPSSRWPVACATRSRLVGPRDGEPTRPR